jgi:hypothetical protein
MGKKIFAFAFAIVAALHANAQFTDNFDDGDFTNNPQWVGGTADFIVNASLQLQSNNTILNSTYYLSTASTQALTAQWEFFAQLSFNPSSANYVDVFLTASASDLTLASTTGYFVRLGNTDDEISLYRKDAAGSVKIIDGTNGVLNTSNNAIRIKVVRDAANQWRLIRDVNATGNFTEGTVTDVTYLTSSFFGMLIKQSTASFFQRHFFDDIVVGNYVPDVVPPVIQTVTATSINTADVLFDEPVDQLTAETAANYVVSNGIGSPTLASRDGANNALVHLSFSGNFPVNTNLQITINGVKDLSDNAISNGTANFSFYTPSQYDIVIDEIMADPTPLVGLPDAEWLELRNTSALAINLQGWRVGKSTGISGPMPSYLLKPDSFVIVCTSSAVALLSPLGPTISVTSFPSLNNTGDLIYLSSPQSTVIHSVNYTDAWYQNELKKGGGWTLEMIDTRNPCTGSANWKASVDPSGGTPGKKNSLDGINADATAPKLLHAYASDSVHVTLVFDEPLNGTVAANSAAYVISDGIGIPSTATPVSPVFDRVELLLGTPLLRNKIYTVTVNGISDCVGNSVGPANTARVGLYEQADSFDIVVNEILFNPKPDGTDYVELYNRSSKILNLKNMYIANLNSSGAISSITQLSNESRLLFPSDFMVVTENATLIKRDFVTLHPDAFVELSSMPSLNDDKGNAIILNEQGNVIDRVAYSDKWHFKLISNKEAVALERIDYDAPSQNEQNWHSAASSVNFGTPTYKNSQSRIDAGVQGEVKVDPEIFSPDNDGRDDFATINYSFPEPGYVTNISIFDAAGRLVRNLQRNALSGLKGYYRWDGLDEKNMKLPVGMYIIYTEVFNLKGKTKKFKNVIVLARKQ